MRYDFLQDRRVILAVFETTPTWPNYICIDFSCELKLVMTMYDSLGLMWVILNDVWMDLNFANGPPCTRIGKNNDQIGFRVAFINDTCLNQLQHAHNFILVLH